ncbi:Ragulator complex protein LAMTOR3 [Pavlovales sp. CCMP2436]|nr:Ragulator complex protein LAMTOR3 [Pavlovales sp. CCMP2436]
MREKAADALARIVNGTHGLLCIVVSDRDGVELHRTGRDGGNPVVLAPALLATFALTAEQVGKLQLGEGSITSIYDNLVVVHSSTGSFTICMVAETGANIGMAMALMPAVRALFAE